MSDTPIVSSSNRSHPSQRLAIARAALILLWFLVAIIALVALPGSYAATQANWQVNEVAGSLGASVSYETLVAVVSGIEMALLGLFLATSALMLAQSPQTIPLLAGFVMMGLPFSFDLVNPSGFNGMVAEVTTALASVLGVAGVLALVLLMLTFPNGRFVSRRLGIAIGLALVIVAALQVAPNIGDSAWLIMILVLFLSLLAALVSQVWRYRHANPEQRRQTVLFLIATLSFVTWVAISFLANSALVNLFLGYLALTLVPVALIAALWRGAWGPEPARSQRLGLCGRSRAAGADLSRRVCHLVATKPDRTF